MSEWTPAFLPVRHQYRAICSFFSTAPKLEQDRRTSALQKRIAEIEPALQPFILGGDSVQAVALNASRRLNDAISSSLASCNPNCSRQPTGLEETHLSVLLADLGPAFCAKHYLFLVGFSSFLKLLTQLIGNIASKVTAAIPSAYVRCFLQCTRSSLNRILSTRIGAAVQDSSLCKLRLAPDTLAQDV